MIEVSLPVCVCGWVGGLGVRECVMNYVRFSFSIAWRERMREGESEN